MPYGKSNFQYIAMAKRKVLKSHLDPEAPLFQPAGIAGAPDATSADDKPNKKTGFLDLPPEVRAMIYDELLRPD